MRSIILLFVASCCAILAEASTAKASDPWLAGYFSYYDTFYRGYSPGYDSYFYPSYTYSYQPRSYYNSPFGSSYLPVYAAAPVMPAYTAYHYPGYQGHTYTARPMYSPSLSVSPSLTTEPAPKPTPPRPLPATPGS
jgi:hypothetical protein